MYRHQVVEPALCGLPDYAEAALNELRLRSSEA
jgi:hypothetical protein